MYCISSHIGHSCREITFKLSKNRDFLQEPSRSSWQAVAACFHAHENACHLSFCISLHIDNSCWEIVFKLSDNQDFLQEPWGSSWRAVAERFHAHEHTFLTFVLHFITYRPLLWRNCLQIVRQSGFSSRAFRKQLRSCCSMLLCPWECISHLSCCISLHIGNFCWEIVFKLSDNHDFLQEPSGSSWRAVAACFHAHEYAFLTFSFAFHHISATPA